MKHLFAALILVFAANLYADDCTSLRRMKVNCQCGVKIVSYRIYAEPGQEFFYDGERFVVSKSGMIELLADKRRNEIVIRSPSATAVFSLWPDDRAPVSCDKFASCAVVIGGR